MYLTCRVQGLKENSLFPLVTGEYRKAELMKIKALIGIFNDVLSIFSVGFSDMAWTVL
jgi:hypothetical protein